MLTKVRDVRVDNAPGVAFVLHTLSTMILKLYTRVQVTAQPIV